MARVRAIERLVAQREVGDDVALDHRLEYRPLEPRGIAQVATLDPAAILSSPRPGCRREIPRPGRRLPWPPAAAGRRAHCTEVRAAARAGSGRSRPCFVRPPGSGSRCARPHRLPAAPAHRTGAGHTADSPVSGARRRPVRKRDRHIPGAELAGQLRRQEAGADGAILERRGVVVELDQLGKVGAQILEKSGYRQRAIARQIDATPPGTTRSIISRWPKQLSAARSTYSRSSAHCACSMAKAASLQMAPISPK